MDGADDESGLRAIHEAPGATRKTCSSTIVKLVVLGADFDARDGHSRTAPSYAAERGNYGSVNELLDPVAGADVDGRDNGGRTALSYAAEHGHCMIVEELTEKGADINAKDNGGRTTLSYAIGSGQGEEMLSS